MVDYVYKQVESLKFGVLSPKVIKKMATAKVVTAELYDKEGYPVDGGLMDVRLGVIDPGLRCKTCSGKLKECLGHFGYIEFARPVIHIKYIKVIYDLLKSTCNDCGRVLVDDASIAKLLDKKERKLFLKRKKMKDYINSIKNIKKCPHCNAKQKTIKFEKPSTFYEGDKRLSPVQIRERFERVPDTDLKVLGINPETARPEWFILTVLPIPPVTVRPSITLESGERSEDDLTHKLGDIVRINQRLFENINAGAPEIIVEDLWDLLQYHVTTYFDNTLAQVPPARHRSGQPLKTITERIKSKEGRFRHNLAGKRVNYSARTVISPDPKIKLNEVGVPYIVAMELTVPERVTEWNLEYLKEFIKNGPKIYPGANYVMRPDGKKKKITAETQETLLEELEPGFIVERHVLDGDIAIFNRQPSLHRMSIMSHKVRVLPGRSFRLNPAVCAPYNADFDGDEMNLHIPQTEEARAEAEILMQVQTQIMTPKHGSNVIGCIHDSVSGSYLLTNNNVEMSKEEAVQLLVSAGVYDLAKFKKLKNKVTGKDIFSVLMPDDFNFIGHSKGCQRCDKCLSGKCKHDYYVQVKKGQLISGLIDSATIGEGQGDLIRALHREVGEDSTLEILNNISRLGIAYLLKRGFTTGIQDTDLPSNITDMIISELKSAGTSVESYIAKYQSGSLEALPGKSVQETLELNLLKVLNVVRNKIGDLILEHAARNNPTVIMASSGARGNFLNLVQMAACVGQQALRGKRIERGYRNRTLSNFKEHDLSPRARGFIEHGFKHGLTPVEFFFGSMTGRDSLMDTALRTPKSGYLYRRLANALQDLKIEYDLTVRDANKRIIQFKYGDDNIDVSKSEKGTIVVSKIIKDVLGE